MKSVFDYLVNFLAAIGFIVVGLGIGLVALIYSANKSETSVDTLVHDVDSVESNFDWFEDCETSNEPIRKLSDSIQLEFGTITQERVSVDFSHQVDIGNAKYLPLRKRPLSDEELLFSNSGKPGSRLFNDEQIIQYLQDGTMVTLLDSANRFYSVELIGFGGLQKGYVLKELAGAATLAYIGHSSQYEDLITPFCRVLLPKKFEEILRENRGSRMEKLRNAFTTGMPIFELFQSGLKRTRVNSCLMMGSAHSIKEEIMTDYQLCRVGINSFYDYILPDLVKSYRVEGNEVSLWLSIDSVGEPDFKIRCIDYNKSQTRTWSVNGDEYIDITEYAPKTSSLFRPESTIETLRNYLHLKWSYEREECLMPPWW